MALLRAIVVFPTLLLFNVSSAADIPCGTAVFGKGAHNGKNRMVGANVATPHAYPWHVFIQTPKGTFSGSAVRFSSGNVIDAVLTSAQVVTVNDKLISPTNVTVYLGLHDRAKKAKARAKVHSIKRFSLSDSPRVQMTASDAAVLYLKLPVPLSEYIRPICLPDEEQIEPNDSCVITGLNHISSKPMRLII
ncbi:Trypsin domain containing protein [Trichuris trichiura]|uniref:Trypsin domain containing protein n=1 Tax=Trichuris trichiura TaxID=36087 RepID=A0A077YZG2_TRITR|nr:Trypsin domain containing protein [Trichuris trichiura]